MHLWMLPLTPALDSCLVARRARSPRILSALFPPILRLTCDDSSDTCPLCSRNSGDLHGQYFDLLRPESGGFPPESNYSSSATTSTAASSRSRRSACFSRTRSSTRRTSSCCAATTSAPPSTASTAFRRVQAKLLDQAVEDVHRLLQLPARLGGRRREDHLHARRPLSRPPEARADLAHHAPHRVPDRACSATCSGRTPIRR